MIVLSANRCTDVPRGRFQQGTSQGLGRRHRRLTVSYSSGAVEGHVTFKMIKRQMYGRAKPDLLRKRVLLAD